MYVGVIKLFLAGPLADCIYLDVFCQGKQAGPAFLLQRVIMLVRAMVFRTGYPEDPEGLVGFHTVRRRFTTPEDFFSLQVFPDRRKEGEHQISRLQGGRSEEHTSELQSLMSKSYAVFGLNK